MDFVDGVNEFIRDGLISGVPTLVATDLRKIDLLKRSLGPLADDVEFVNMHEAGRNPARIIPLWRKFLDANPGPIVGVGEPVWFGRTPDELVECHHHEMLLNVAFGDRQEFALLCPYETNVFDRNVVKRIGDSHGGIREDGGSHDCAHASLGAGASPFSGALSDPPAKADEVQFTIDNLSSLRELTKIYAEHVGIGPLRLGDVELAITEVASNSVRHGGGSGSLKFWHTDDAVVFEVQDRGHFTDPLLGRVLPSPTSESGRGLWVTNQLVDLLQLRNTLSGTVLRMTFLFE